MSIETIPPPVPGAGAPHASTHVNAAADEINVTGLSGVLADPQPPIIGAGAAQAVAGNDSRLTDARTPTVHASTHNAAGSDVLAIDAAAGTGSLRTLGTSATSAAAGNDSRLLAPVPHQTGLYYGPSAMALSSTSLAQSQLRVMPIYIPVTATYTRIGINVTATPLNTVRLGIYANSGSLPGALVLDAGTVDGSTTGFKEITISQSLTAGWYWIGAANQGAVGIVQVASSAGTSNVLGAIMPGDGSPGSTSFCYYLTGITGALPNPFGTPGGRTQIAPFIWLKI